MPAPIFQRRLFFAAFLLVLCAAAAHALGQNPLVFQTVGEILRQPQEVIGKSPRTQLTGVVTSAEVQWGTRIFIADDTGGIQVIGPNPGDFQPGDLVTVEGVVNSGPFAPLVATASARKLGRHTLPKPKPASVGELFTGGNEGQWVEISGWVRSIWKITPSLVGANLVSGGSRISIRVSGAANMDLANLLGARVRVRGVASAVRSRPVTRQVLEVRLFAATPEDFSVEERDTTDPLAGAPLPYMAAFQFQPGNSPGRRVRVAGTVTYQVNDLAFLTDGKSGLAMRTAQAVTLHSGNRIEAVGFPDVERFLPVLSDAVVLTQQKSADPIRPMATTTELLRTGLQHANYVSVTGQLLDRMMHPSAAISDDAAPEQALVLSLKTTDGVFEVDVAEKAGPALLARLEPGSLLEISGICLAQTDAAGAPAGFKLLAPSAQHIRILRAAPFFNTQRLLLTLCGSLAILLLLAGWAVMLTRRNAVLAAEVRERTAVNGERSRLARELHDSLEQSLVGIDLQIASADLATDENLDETREHLTAARTLVKQSHGELRQSIWNLRSPLPEPFDLADALRRMAKMLADGSGVQITVTSDGTPFGSIADLIEENLFRIGQEALTNAIKHAHASQIVVALRYAGERLELTITDDGLGFSGNPAEWEESGHFGLLGMRERAQRIGAELTIENHLSHGAVVRVVVPCGKTETPLPPGNSIT